MYNHIDEPSRKTLAVLLIRNGREVFFVQSAKDPEGRTWNFPQFPMGPKSTEEAFADGIKKELGILPEDSRLLYVDSKYSWDIFVPMLFTGEHKNAKNCAKSITVVPAATDTDQFKLDETNSKCVPVTGEWAMESLLGHTVTHRPWKFNMFCEAINQAHEKGLLKWSCKRVQQQVGQFV